MPSSWRLLFATEGTVALPALSSIRPNSSFSAKRQEQWVRGAASRTLTSFTHTRLLLSLSFSRKTTLRVPPVHACTRRTLRACSVLVAEKTIPREEMPVHSFRVITLVVCTYVYVRRIPESVVVSVECTDWGMFVRESTRRVVVCQKARTYRVYNNIVHIHSQAFWWIEFRAITWRGRASVSRAAIVHYDL